MPDNRQGDLFPADDFVPIKISAKCARETFEGCSLAYITSTCHGKCCTWSGDHNASWCVAVLPHEEGPIRARGAMVENGVMLPVPGENHCPFLAPNGLCNLHDAGQKPMACYLSPFTLNDNDTLIIKNRNRRLTCYKDKVVALTPAYIAYRYVLELLFGKPEAARIVDHLNAGGDDMIAHMPRYRYEQVRTIRHAHHQHLGMRT